MVLSESVQSFVDCPLHVDVSWELIKRIYVEQLACVVVGPSATKPEFIKYKELITSRELKFDTSFSI